MNGAERMSIAQSKFENIMTQHEELIICGGGHVSIPIIKIGKLLDFRVTVLEDRPLYSDHARAAGADRVICDTFQNALSQTEGGSNAYFVVVTRGHRYDMECLRSIFAKEYAYIGMMGSKVRSREVRQTFAAEGILEEEIAKLHSPIGLQIGGETPGEIAVSVMAEIVQIRNQIRKGKKADGYTQEIIQALLTDDDRNRCLTTIISRKGSAPRSVGTKMVVFEDGACTGTIGGGCVEAQVVKDALYMMRNAVKDSRVLEINMLPEQAEEEGMVCGGIIKISLDVIDLEV